MCTCSPVRQIFALWWECKDPGITVAVRHIDVSVVWVHGDISRLAEMVLIRTWHKSLSQNQQRLLSAIAAHFQHLRQQGIITEEIHTRILHCEIDRAKMSHLLRAHLIYELAIKCLLNNLVQEYIILSNHKLYCRTLGNHKCHKMAKILH